MYVTVCLQFLLTDRKPQFILLARSFIVRRIRFSLLASYMEQRFTETVH